MEPMRQLPTDEMTLAGILYALGDPVRLEIVQTLARQGEQPCRHCADRIAKSTLSHHFKILREAGVVASRKVGTQHLNSLRRQDIDRRFPGLLGAILAAVDEDLAGKDSIKGA